MKLRPHQAASHGQLILAFVLLLHDVPGLTMSLNCTWAFRERTMLPRHALGFTVYLNSLDIAVGIIASCVIVHACVHDLQIIRTAQLPAGWAVLASLSMPLSSPQI